MKMCVMCLEKLAEKYSDCCKECQKMVKEQAEIHKKIKSKEDEFYEKSKS